MFRLRCSNSPERGSINWCSALLEVKYFSGLYLMEYECQCCFQLFIAFLIFGAHIRKHACAKTKISCHQVYKDFPQNVCVKNPATSVSIIIKSVGLFPEPCDSSVPELIPVSIALRDWEYYSPALDGMLVHRRLSPQL